MDMKFSIAYLLLFAGTLVVRSAHSEHFPSLIYSQRSVNDSQASVYVGYGSQNNADSTRNDAKRAEITFAHHYDSERNCYDRKDNYSWSTAAREISFRGVEYTNYDKYGYSASDTRNTSIEYAKTYCDNLMNYWTVAFGQSLADSADIVSHVDHGTYAR